MHETQSLRWMVFSWLHRKTRGKCHGHGAAAKIRWWHDWSFHNFDAMEIRRSSSMKFDGARV